MRTLYAFLAGLVILGGLAACSPGAPPVATAPAATSAIEGATPAASVEARLNPTEAVGGGALASNAISADDVAKVFATVSQASQLTFSANSSPPGATGADVMTVSVVMYKNLGLSNTDIALYTSWLYLPWVIKPLWSPVVDLLGTKRRWIVPLQFVIGAMLAGVALAR